MKEIVSTYKKEIQQFLNNEAEVPAEIALPSVGSDLQEALVIQRRRLKKYELKLIFKEAFLKDSKQEGEYVKEYIQDTRRYIFESGGGTNISGMVRKAYCVKEDTDAKKKVTFVEVKEISLKPYIRKLNKFIKYYFGDTENVKTVLTDFWFMFIGFFFTIFLAFLSTGVHSIFYANRPMESFAAWFWPIPCMWVILATVRIIRNKPRLKRKSPRVTMLSIQDRKPDFSPEKFIAMAAARLECIYYAEAQEEIGAFTEGDLSYFLDAHKDVVNCELTSFIFDDFYVTKDYMYMTVEQKVILDRSKQGRIEQQEETVIVRFVKARNSIMSEDFYQDWYVTDVEVVGDIFGE